ASQDLIDLLGEECFAGMHDQALRSRIGQPLREQGQNAESLVELANTQEAGIRDDASALKSDGDLLRTEVPKRKLLRTACHHDLEPFGCGKFLFSCNLSTTKGSFVNQRCVIRAKNFWPCCWHVTMMLDKTLCTKAPRSVLLQPPTLR